MKLVKAIQQRYINWVREQAIKQNLVGPATVVQYRASRQAAHDFDFKAHLKVYLVNVYCYAAIKAIAQDVAMIPVHVQRKVTGDPKRQWETVNEGKLWDFLEAPNPYESRTQLVERTIIAELAAGNGYWAFDPVESHAHYVKPDWVTVNIDPIGRPVGYEAQNGGVRINLEYLQMIHWRLSNPTGDFYGMPPGEVIMTTIMAKLEMNNYIRSYFENDATPGTTFSTDKSLGPEQREALRKEFERMHAGTDNAGRLGILSDGAKLDRLAPFLKDLVPKEIDELIKGEVCAAYGVPPVRIGSLDGATYANANAQLEVYYRSTVIPHGRHFWDTANRQLTPQFDKTKRERIYWDEESIPALQSDEAEQITSSVAAYQGGLCTLNEGRERCGWEPFDAELGGDDRYTAPVVDPLFGVDNADDQSQLSIKSNKGKNVGRLLAWRRLDAQRTRHENRFRVEMRKYFRAQRDRLIAKVDKESSGGKYMNRLVLIASKDVINDPDNIDNLFDATAESAVLMSQVGPLLPRIVDQSGQESLDAFRIRVSFNVRNPKVSTVLSKARSRMEDINDVTYQRLKQIFRDAFNAGSSVDEIVRSIREEFDFIEKTRADRIARTEIGAIQNGAADAAYQQAGVTHKEWIATQDPITRDAHAAADGQVVRVGESFHVGEEMLEFPSDPNGSPENVINCRCAEGPAFPEDEEEQSSRQILLAPPAPTKPDIHFTVINNGKDDEPIVQVVQSLKSGIEAVIAKMADGDKADSQMIETLNNLNTGINAVIEKLPQELASQLNTALHDAIGKVPAMKVTRDANNRITSIAPVEGKVS